MRKMLFQKKCLPVLFLFFVCTLLFVAGCKQKGSSPPDYDLGSPETTLLGSTLNEISGISYISAEDSTLLGIVDGQRKVFMLNMRTAKLSDYTVDVVPANSDPEDIVKKDSSVFVLLSKGIIYEVPDAAKDTVGIKIYDLGLKGKNDFETMYYDSSENALVIMCKTCAHEESEGLRTAYRFDLATRTFDSTEFFTVDKGEVRKLVNDADAKFDPSGAAIHPVNKRLYILSSAGNLLVITTVKGEVLEAYNLNPDVFPQSEGIAFAPNGDMFISNEKKHGEPTLLRFPYKPQKSKK
ncbi:SdiA-regulated domain-containing protein [Flavisolibacter sp. BT320]|nr:SdiA-regulated domain-containing protein [Flavisolibacter longurius]